MKNIFAGILGLILVCSNLIFAQSEMTLMNMNNIFQASYINPSLIPDYKVSVGLGTSVYSAFSNSSFNLPNGILTGDTVDLKKVSNSVRKNNVFYTAFAVDLFHLRVKQKRNFWSFNITQKVSNFQSIPGDLLLLAINGNTQFVGKEVSLKKFGANYTSYMEMGLGLARESANKKFTYGARVKLLFGQANVYVSRSKGGLTVGDNTDGNSLKADADVVIHSSYPKDWESADNTTPNYSQNVFNTKNMGAAIDAAVTYKPTEKFRVMLAINDLGFIRWTQNPYNTSYKGNYTYNGIDVSNISNKNSDQDTYQSYFDSLAKSFNGDTTQKAYTAPLVMKSYLSASYQLAKNTTVNANFFMNYFRVIQPAYGISVNQRVCKFIEIAVSYSVQNRQWNNVGFGIYVKGGPFQLFCVADNLTPLFNSVDLSDGSIDFRRVEMYNFNVRSGLNFIFGRIVKEDKLPVYDK